MDCGVACLRMISSYHGKKYPVELLRKDAKFGKEGVSILGISDAAEKIGFKASAVQLTLSQLIEEVQAPCILHWNQNHFIVMIPQSLVLKNRRKVYVADPAQGVLSYSLEEFKQRWIHSTTESGYKMGIALLLEPSGKFYEGKREYNNGYIKSKKFTWSLLIRYMLQGRWKLFQILLTVFITSLLQLIFPFLTKSIIDVGVNSKKIHFVIIILLAQVMLVFSRSVVEFVRVRILLNISILINLSILSDFMIKLTRLPLSYFESYRTSDTLQRINDNKKIQSFLTGPALSTFFSLITFLVFTIVLLTYSPILVIIFVLGNVIYFLWVRCFLDIRRKLNYQNFELSSKENASTLQLAQGMQEIRLNTAEKQKRWEWEDIQVMLSRLSVKNLTYNQLQQAGAIIISQGKDIIITFFVAEKVITGELTLGTMLAVQYILGQLSGPIEQFVSFFQGAQDAKISLERLNDVQNLDDEEEIGKDYVKNISGADDLVCKNLIFSYPASMDKPVLDDVTFTIPAGKVTAIVGVSGSGKTSLLKLLLKYYEITGGTINVGETNLNEISPTVWRKQCGAVLQEGFIFNDNIAKNISVSDEKPDVDRLILSCKIANILTFIESLPNGFNTLLGVDGIGISQGQKQRLLIARAVYKNPHYLFFDEATNALDATNESEIVSNLENFFNGKTVVIVAHRLSTVKNADNIIVLNEGVIVEQGTHQELTKVKGMYYELVKNQLELGN